MLHVCFLGASDCAVCVGVCLEIARSLIQTGKKLETPILFLFNGGEETLMQVRQHQEHLKMNSMLVGTI